jgi:hypothetical protein
MTDQKNRTKSYFNLSSGSTYNSNRIEGQNGPRKVVDDENLTYFIIRYRCTGRKYTGNPLTNGENTIYNIHL